MKNIFLFLSLSVLILSCSTEVSKSDESLDGTFASSESSSSGSGTEAGLITAGEWNDLENWDFWNTINMNDTFSVHQDYWGIFPNDRISILVLNEGQPVKGAEVELYKNGESVFKAMSDHQGKVEFFINVFEGEYTTTDDFVAIVEGVVLSNSLYTYDFGINEIEYELSTSVNNKVQLSFIVDATGSMGDEIEFLKDDLNDVIQRAETGLGNYIFESSAVFYRDEGDAYLTKESDFSSNISTTINFIQDQNAGGGGNFPEAVHSGLEECLKLNWDKNSHTKIAFLLLDAPRHYQEDVIRDLKNSLELASAQGIKIIPICASGIDKETEFLMRYFSIVTNGTYVFITNDSGIGNNHISATVGEHEIEFLNDLLVRIIKEHIS